MMTACHVRARGFTYLGLLFAIVFMGLALALIAQVARTVNQREKERQLLFVGKEISRAIGRYYDQSPGSVKQFPRTLPDLLLDKRYPDVRRYLRKVYADPMSGKADWGVVSSGDGGIAGVYSQSLDAPFKVAGFPADADFSDRKKYAEWVFEYQPTTAPDAAPAAPDGNTAPAAGTTKPVVPNRRAGVR
jgi:type II secretory pathway pseudopilin PulG